MSGDVVRPDAASSENLSRVLAVWVSALLVVGVGVFGLLVVRDFNRSLEPELERRATLIGATIRDDIERALNLGIPLSGLVGVEEYFAVFLADFPEVDYLAIRDQRGVAVTAVSARGAEGEVGEIDPAAWRYVDEPAMADSVAHRFTVSRGADAVGSVDVGVDSSYVRSKLDDLALDVGVILIVAVVVAFEVALAVSRRFGVRRRDRSTGVPMGSAVGRNAGDIRLVLLVFVIAEELNKSFLPLFIKAADNPIGGLDANVAISLPIVAYLLTMAVVSPFAGRLEASVGQRGLFLIGLVSAALSHLGMIFAGNVLQIMVLRSLTGIGYAMATIACMEYLLERLSPGNRARSVGVFVTVVMGGTFVGTALGGIFADRLGYDAVFVISFALVVIAGASALGVMRSGKAVGGQRASALSLRDIGSVLKRPSLLVLLGGVTIPMNVVMAAFLWYLVPLTMSSVGSDASAIARTLMVYYLVILVGGPLVGRIAGKLISYRLLVGIGSIMSGAVLLLPAFTTTELTISVAVLVVGIGHAAVRGPQIALAMDIADAELPGHGRDAAMAAMRSLERLGSLAGLLVVAVLAGRFDLDFAIGAVGVAGTVAGLAFVAARPFLRPRSARA